MAESGSGRGNECEAPLLPFEKCNATYARVFPFCSTLNFPKSSYQIGEWKGPNFFISETVVKGANRTVEQRTDKSRGRDGN